jgi:methylenetetrahydrofolate reductase (NADPH)
LSRLVKDPYITYYAANRAGDSKTNVADRESQNAVTWGVFPGKEIVQPTIIEHVSFDAWRVRMNDIFTFFFQKWEILEAKL